MKNVLILSGSPRKGGNSDLLCDEFMRGAKESGNNVTKINVASKKIAPCHACYFCGEHGGECVYKDDMAEILQAMIDTDVLVLASPVYFYSVDAQMKALIDRRVDKMAEEGLLEEVQALLAMGLPRNATAMQAIGYKEFLGVLDGILTEQEALELVKLRSRQYAKRQLTWLRRNPAIHWIYWEKDRDFARALQISTEILTASGLG